MAKSIASLSSGDLLRRFFEKAGQQSAEVLGRTLGVSPQSVRGWRAAVETGAAPDLRGHVREKISAYLEGRPVMAPDVAQLLAEHQRNLAELARDYTRQIVDAVTANIDSALAETDGLSDPPEGSPRPNRGKGASGSAAVAALSPEAAIGAADAMRRHLAKPSAGARKTK